MQKDITFEPLAPFADINFWQEFNHIKLDKMKLDDSPIPIYGTYTPTVNKFAKSSILNISENCLPGSSVTTLGGLVESKINGVLQNLNTLEQFQDANRKLIAGINLGNK